MICNKKWVWIRDHDETYTNFEDFSSTERQDLGYIKRSSRILGVDVFFHILPCRYTSRCMRSETSLTRIFYPPFLPNSGSERGGRQQKISSIIDLSLSLPTSPLRPHTTLPDFLRSFIQSNEESFLASFASYKRLFLIELVTYSYLVTVCCSLP